ncbi:hypothetical protein ACK8HY_10010 [Sphingobacterium sp. NGMCC 1.201703]|uniref:hypothetical protein n=1 Tax=Sphingobacterium sp. NGMCC 1.201703 TaxID=3388657 RepID=UPI0039FD13F8
MAEHISYIQVIKVPITADLVLSPTVLYDENGTSICFETEDEQFGRITIQKMDGIKICRGEIPPYHDPRKNWEDFEPGTWVYRVENSKWLMERYHYEKKHYGQSYDWGNSVEEMLTDYSHYYFSFHDEFVEVIAKGFWWEKAEQSLQGKPLSDGHPFLKLQTDFTAELKINDGRFYIKINPKSHQELNKDVRFCHQTIMEVWARIKGEYYQEGTVKIKENKGGILSYYQPQFGKEIIVKKGIANLADLEDILLSRS